MLTKVRQREKKRDRNHSLRLHGSDRLFAFHRRLIKSMKYKRHKTEVENCLFSASECTKIVWRPGSTRTSWGSLQRSRTPWLHLLGKGREEGEGKRKGVEKKEEEREREEEGVFKGETGIGEGEEKVEGRERESAGTGKEGRSPPY